MLGVLGIVLPSFIHFGSRKDLLKRAERTQPALTPTESSPLQDGDALPAVVPALRLQPRTVIIVGTAVQSFLARATNGCRVRTRPANAMSMREIVIRPARRGDMPEIRALISRFPDELVQTDLPRVQSFFVAEQGTRVVGCCALQVYSRRLAEIRSLAVHPSFRERGVGASLVAACRRRASERRVQQILVVTSEPSFFEQRGFTVHPGWKTALFHDLDPRS